MKLGKTVLLSATIAMITGSHAFAWGSGSSSSIASSSSLSMNELAVSDCESPETLTTYGFELDDFDWHTANRATIHDQYGSRAVGPPSNGPLHTIEERFDRTSETSNVHYMIKQTRIIFADNVLNCAQTLYVLERN